MTCFKQQREEIEKEIEEIKTSDPLQTGVIEKEIMLEGKLQQLNKDEYAVRKAMQDITLKDTAESYSFRLRKALGFVSLNEEKKQ